MSASEETRHVLSLSGGKDSAALGFHIRRTRPEVWEKLEVVFADTLKELPETYRYLEKLEMAYNRPIVRIGHEGGFDAVYAMKNEFLPNARHRWCTELLKIRPFLRHIGKDRCVLYLGIRADENGRGYVAPKGSNITPSYPFVEDGIDRADVERILEEEGVGLPDYYSWRTRSGCFFCFYQQKIEWVGLLKNHPDLFEAAKSYEKPERGFSWMRGEFLHELENPARYKQIELFDCLKAIRNSQKTVCGGLDDEGEDCAWCHR